MKGELDGFMKSEEKGKIRKVDRFEKSTRKE